MEDIRVARAGDDARELQLGEREVRAGGDGDDAAVRGAVVDAEGLVRGIEAVGAEALVGNERGEIDTRTAGVLAG